MAGTKRQSGSPQVKAESVSSAVVPPHATASHKRSRIVPCSCPSNSSAPSPVKSADSFLCRQNLERPTQQECLYVTTALGKLHPDVLERNQDRKLLGSCGLQDTILDGVVSTILSQNTTSANSTRAFAKLKDSFPQWEHVESLPNPVKLEESIRSAGLAKIKSERIYNMIKTIKQERGSVSLEHLRDLSDEQVKEDLIRFKGMGPKTISCVMLFAMQRPEFPVDTHVHRICKQMGWIGSSANREGAYEHLNATVPPELKLDLHCLLIAHGKQCHRCAARGKPQFPPKDGTKLVCPLVNLPQNMKNINLATAELVKSEA